MPFVALDLCGGSEKRGQAVARERHGRQDRPPAVRVREVGLSSKRRRRCFLARVSCEGVVISLPPPVVMPREWLFRFYCTTNSHYLATSLCQCLVYVLCCAKETQPISLPVQRSPWQIRVPLALVETKTAGERFAHIPGAIHECGRMSTQNLSQTAPRKKQDCQRSATTKSVFFVYVSFCFSYAVAEFCHGGGNRKKRNTILNMLWFCRFYGTEGGVMLFGREKFNTSLRPRPNCFGPLENGAQARACRNSRQGLRTFHGSVHGGPRVQKVG